MSRKDFYPYWPALKEIRERFDARIPGLFVHLGGQLFVPQGGVLLQPAVCLDDFSGISGRGQNAITFGKQGERETISRRGAFMRIRWLARRECHVRQTAFGIDFRMRAYRCNQQMRSGGDSRGSSGYGVGNPTGAGESGTAAATRGADRIVSRRTGRGHISRVFQSA